MAYAANTYPAHYATSLGEDHPGKDDSHLAEGLDGLLGEWVGDGEDPAERD
jgi:hypothetical protein